MAGSVGDQPEVMRVSCLPAWKGTDSSGGAFRDTHSQGPPQKRWFRRVRPGSLHFHQPHRWFLCSQSGQCGSHATWKPPREMFCSVGNDPLAKN